MIKTPFWLGTAVSRTEPMRVYSWPFPVPNKFLKLQQQQKIKVFRPFLENPYQWIQNKFTSVPDGGFRHAAARSEMR